MAPEWRHASVGEGVGSADGRDGLCGQVSSPVLPCLTGRSPPTARDRDTPFRQVLVWAPTITAVAVAAASVVVDQWVLRPKPAGPSNVPGG